MLLGATLIQNFVKTLDPGNVFDLSRFALCIMLILMALLWLRAGTIELGYLQYWIRTGHFRTKRPFMIFAVFMIVAAYLSVLMIYAPRVHVFFTLYAVYLIIDMFTWKLRMDEIKLAIDDLSRFLRKELTALIETPASNAKEFDMKIIDTYVKGLAMIRNFYFQKPQRMRIVITLAMVIVLAAIAFTFHLSLAGSHSLGYFGELFTSPLNARIRAISAQVPTDWLRAFAYFLFAVLICASEWVLAGWRTELRHELSSLDERLFAICNS